MADDINLPNLVSHLAVNLDGLSGTVADAGRQGSSVGAALGGGIQRELRDLLAHLPTIDVDASTDEVDRDLARVRQQLDELAGERIGVDVSITDALRRLEELEPHLQRLSDTHPNITVQATTRAALRQLEELRDAARRADDTDVNIDVDVDTDRPNRLAGILGGLAGLGARAGASIAAGFAKGAAAIGTAVPLAAAVAQTLANVAPAAGVAVTGMAAVQLASGAVKLAAVGMEDAISAALDPSKAEEFSEALEKLSPEARKFAEAVHEAAPALRDMQQAVQNEVFRGLGDELKRTGASVLPILRKNLVSAGGALNDMAKGVSTSARELAEDGTLGKALGSASKGLHNLSGVPGIVVKSLGQIAAAAGPSFERLTERAADAAEGIGDRLTAAFEDGRMEGAIEGALDLLGQVWEIGSNVAEIFQQIFNAVPEGGGILGVLEQITASLAEVAARPEVQEALRTLFETIGVIGETAAPLLAEALALIAPILTELGPPVQELVVALGEGLRPIIEELGRSGLLREMAGALGEVLVAVAPLLPPLGQLISAILPYLIPLVQGVANGAKMLGDFIREFAVPAVQILTDLLRGDFSSALQGAKDLARDMVTSIVVSFATLPDRARSAISDLKPVLAKQIGLAAAAMVEGVRQGIAQMVISLAGLATQARNAVGNLGAVLVRAGADLIAGFIRGIRSMIPSVQDVLGGLTSSLPDWKGPASKDARILTPAGRLLIEGFIKGIDESTARLRQRLQSITKALPSNVKSGYGKALKKATAELAKLVSQRDAVIKRLAAAEKKLKDLINQRTKISTDVRQSILDSGNIVAGHADVNSVTAITVGLQQALKKAQEFQANIAKLKGAGLRSDLLQQIAEAGVEAGGATAAALAKATPEELKKINDLQGQLAKTASSTGNMVGDALYGAGIRAAQGLVAGLKSQERAIEAVMRRIAEGMLATVKKTHKTNSPSRAFRWLGEMDGRGLEQGLLASVGRVRAAARTMAGAALDVASGVRGAVSVTPSAAQLSQVYAGGAVGGDRYYTINLYGSDATPQGIVRELSWLGLVGRG